MSWRELREEALKLSVSDRLFLVEAIVQSLSHELRPRPPVPEELWDRLRGSLKTDETPLTDIEIEAMLKERLEEKYL